MLCRSSSMSRDKLILTRRSVKETKENTSLANNWVSYAFINHTKRHLLTAISLSKEQTIQKAIRNRPRGDVLSRHPSSTV